MDATALSDAKRRLVDLLKLRGPLTAAELAGELGFTEVAARQHLGALESAGLARSTKREGGGRGRPSLEWSLSAEAEALFPDRHGELTVGLIDAMREAFGEKGLDKLIAARTAQQAHEYSALMPRAKASLRARVTALAEQRTREGYMAEVQSAGRGAYLLVEHHCPICEAAKCCLKLCGSELDVFRAALGDGVTVERTQHLLAGDARCVYRITKR
ncbi:MAG: transcriptional regulator [Planctomycetota bacterium]|nr:MAG: transcriptional regulator [Planctomycetota bacterium]